jgi:tellurite resistance protein TerC
MGQGRSIAMLAAMNLLRRILISFVGGSVLLIGIAMIFLPAPGSLVIPVGLAILAIEFTWARHWLAKVRNFMPGKKNGASSGGAPTVEPAKLSGK